MMLIGKYGGKIAVSAVGLSDEYNASDTFKRIVYNVFNIKPYYDFRFKVDNE